MLLCWVLAWGHLKGSETNSNQKNSNYQNIKSDQLEQTKNETIKIILTTNNKNFKKILAKYRQIKIISNKRQE